MSIKIKRIYDCPTTDDGYRILVDRLWPRGISKQRAHLDFWLKDVAPSTSLRKWYGHRPERHEEFKLMYEKELQEKEECINGINKIKEIEKKEVVTLLYAAKNPIYNHANILLNYIKLK